MFHSVSEIMASASRQNAAMHEPVIILCLCLPLQNSRVMVNASMIDSGIYQPFPTSHLYSSF